MNLIRGNCTLAIAAWILPPLVVSCASLRNDDSDNDADSGPSKLSDRISNFDRNKEFDKKSLDIYKAYSEAPRQGFEKSRFSSKRFTDIKPVEASRFNTERYKAEDAYEQQRRKWYPFAGGRNKEQKASPFTQRRSPEDGATYGTRRFPDESSIESTIGSRAERDITDRVMATEIQGSGGAAAAAPTVIREATMSEGDIRALLNNR